MPLSTGPWIAADGLRGVADNTTSTVIALLSLLAVVVLCYGLIRAIVMNRRPQIVMADLTASSSFAEHADAVVLSSVVRQYIQRQISDQRTQIVRIGKEILSPASKELELQLDDATVARVQQAASDSIGTLLAALRAVAPDAANRFVGLFSVILPPPRGVSVGVALIQRGASTALRIGVSVEVVRLDGRPLASEMFWEPPSASSSASATRAESTERILGLLEPVTRWVAVRLVLALMVSAGRRVARPAGQGLRQLLVGGLFLQAMRDFPDHALTFGEQACAELEHARQLLPRTTLPGTTLAGVHERMAWAHQKAGEPAQASNKFRAAATLWKEAEDITSKEGDAAEAKLAMLHDRRLKAQLETGDPALRKAALAELASISAPTAFLANRIWLYNRACLYAQASEADPGADYQERALLWLGLALMLYHDSSTWDYAEHHDPALTPIRSVLSPFLICLRSVISDSPAQLSQGDAETLVAQAVSRVYSQY